MQEQKDWEMGKERDHFQMTVLPKESSAGLVCGVALRQIEEAVRGFAVQDGEGGREVGMIRATGSEGWEREMLLRGEFPVVD